MYFVLPVSSFLYYKRISTALFTQIGGYRTTVVYARLNRSCSGITRWFRDGNSRALVADNLSTLFLASGDH